MGYDFFRYKIFDSRKVFHQLKLQKKSEIKYSWSAYDTLSSSYSLTSKLISDLHFHYGNCWNNPSVNNTESISCRNEMSMKMRYAIVFHSEQKIPKKYLFGSEFDVSLSIYVICWIKIVHLKMFEFIPTQSPIRDKKHVRSLNYLHRLKYNVTKKAPH